MGTRFLLGAMAILLIASLGLGYLWTDAREDAQKAADAAKAARDELARAQDAENRLRELADALSGTLAFRETLYRESAEDLAGTRRTLTDIRAAAREEPTDASLACAVLPVPDAIDRLLREPADDGDPVPRDRAAGSPDG